MGRKAAEPTCSNRGKIDPTAPGTLHHGTRIAGEVRGTVVICDRVVNPGMAWTIDGLFAGSFFPGRVDDGLPGWVYEWQRDWDSNKDSLINHDCYEGGVIAEHNGKIYFFSPGRNSIVLYRVHGYDQNEWIREERTVELRPPVPYASQQGTGLQAEYFANPDLRGEPVAVKSGVHPGQLDIPKSIDTAKGVSVRLRGWLEPLVTEHYRIWSGGGGVRLWIDGKQVLERWSQSYQTGTLQDRSAPVALIAGKRVPIQIEYFSTQERSTEKEKKTTRDLPTSELLWESFSLDPDDVPRVVLYSTPVPEIAPLQARPATQEIPANSYDHAISSAKPRFDSFHWRQHIVGLSKGEHLGYRNLDFGKGVRTVIFGLRGSVRPCKAALRLDSVDGPVIATFELSEGKNYGQEFTVEREVAGATGVHDLYITADSNLPFRWFAFK